MLVAVGLEPVDEFVAKAREFGLPVFAAGDSEEIAEASAAMFTGRIRGLEIARALGRDVGEMPPEWHRTAEMLKSRPGATVEGGHPRRAGRRLPGLPLRAGDPLQPVHVDLPAARHPHRGRRPHGAAGVRRRPVRRLREVRGHLPGSGRHAGGLPEGRRVCATVTIPYEFTSKSIAKGDTVTVLDTEGAMLGNVEVTRVREAKADGPLPPGARQGAARDRAGSIAGIRVQEPWVTEPGERLVPRLDDEMIVCRCERVTAGEIRGLIRAGVRDLNELKAITRAGMGACGGKTCPSLIKRLFREEGVPDSQITDFTKRPVFMEVPLGAFAGVAAESGAAGRGARRATRPTRTREACDEHRDVRCHHHRRRQRGTAHGALPGGAGRQAAGHRPVRERRPGQQQGRHRRHPRHPFLPGEDPPVPGVAPDLLDAGGDLRRQHRVGAWRLHVRGVPGRRKNGRSRTLLLIQQAAGLNIDWLGRDQMAELVPALNRDGLRGGTYSPEDGSASPMLSARAFYKRAVERGAEFRFNERVTGLIRRRGCVVGVRTDKGGYATETVINAGGAWARPIAAMGGLDVPVVPDSHEAGITEPVAPFMTPMVVDIRPTEGSKNYYFYQHKPGGVVFCITPDPPIVGTDRRETSSYLPMIARRMVGLMPKLANVKVRRTWRGLYPMTPDGSPIVGRSRELEGYIHAVGMCGQGYMLGPGVGQAADAHADAGRRPPTTRPR